MYALFLILPFNVFLVSMAFGRILGRKGSVNINIFVIMLTFIISLFIFYEVCYSQSTVIVSFYEWFIIDIYSVDFGLL
jgi:NADH:ubiquinone oxidoreductase subunit 5 (subunit L)/multisubunit Na+/H+ antiporter MnhA subunit